MVLAAWNRLWGDIGGKFEIPSLVNTREKTANSVFSIRDFVSE
jgi:hypothetical protein